MGARFSPVSLLIDLDGEPWELDRSALWPAHATDTDRRALFHEAVHYWQYLSQSFLINLASEEWERLIAYEHGGHVHAPGPIRREFDRSDKASGFSARDLQEALARFWDVIAMGPRTVIESEWNSQRAMALPDVREMYRRQKIEAGLPDGAWDQNDLEFAMLMVAGQYARPFTAVSGAGLPHATFVFPWLAQFAMHTSHPATMFARFVDQVAEEIGHGAQRLLTSSRVPEDHRFVHVMSQLGFAAASKCVSAAAQAGEEVRLPPRAYRESSLPSHPLYRWLFEGPVHRATSALTRTSSVQRRAHAFARGHANEATRWFLAQQTLHDLLATPGLRTSRQVVLHAGLAPPAVRQPERPAISLCRVYRMAATDEQDDLAEVDVFRELMTASLSPALNAEDQAVLRKSAEIELRWVGFTAAGHEDESS